MIKNNTTHSMGKGMIIISLLLGLGMLTYFFEQKIEQQYNPNQDIESSYTADNQVQIVLQRNRKGHYVTTGTINGQTSVFLLDTGATYVAVPEKQAHRLGLTKGPAVNISTANGISTGYQTIISSLSMGKIELQNVRAIITPRLSEVLLGMSVLKQLEFTQQGDQLTIRQYL